MPGTNAKISDVLIRNEADLVRKIKHKPIKPERPDPQFFYKPEFGDFFDWLETWQKTQKVNLIDQDNLHKPVNPKVGVMNPYVLARVISKSTRGHLTRDKRFFKLPGDDLVEVLQTYQTFDKDCTEERDKISFFKDVFNPEKSPLFKPLLKGAISLNYGTVDAPMMTGASDAMMHFARTPVDLKYDPVTLSQAGATFHSRGIARREGVGGDENTGVPYPKADKWGTVTEELRPGLTGTAPAQGTSCPMLYRPGKLRCELANDPMQGICLDCYFMAALYSVALKYYNVFPPALNPVNGVYSISFYNASDLSSSRQTLKSTYPVTTAGHMVFAQQTPEFELWAALYEKAYAKFCNLGQSSLPGNENGDPEIGSFGQADAMPALTHLTKLLYTESGMNNTANHPSVFKLPLTHPTEYGATSYATLLNYDAVTCTNPVHHMALYPTVAWVSDIRNSNDAGLYDNPAIVRYHAYSVLGLFEGDDDYGVKQQYIVLRNPWANTIDRTSGYLTAVKPYLAKGTWTSPEASFSVTFGAKADGIFGLMTSKFDALFAGFGWVQFTKAQITS